MVAKIACSPYAKYPFIRMTERSDTIILGTLGISGTLGIHSDKLSKELRTNHHG